MIGHTISHNKVLSKHGEVGMGMVYEAVDTKLDRVVALKFLAPHLKADEEARKHFIHEAQTAAALNDRRTYTIFVSDEYHGQSLRMVSAEGCFGRCWRFGRARGIGRKGRVRTGVLGKKGVSP